MYDFKKVEEEMLKHWEENKIFQKLMEQNKGKEKYRFIDGPITANNPMGVHHAYSRTLKDAYQRLKAMQGYNQRFQNGFDCHGLPVEVVVEKDLGISTKKELEQYGIEKFIEKCKQRVAKMSEIQKQQSIRLGQWMDWDNSYYTMSDENIETIWAFLKKTHEKNMLYKGHKVVPWCWRCGTSLSQHELADGYKELTHDTVYLQFKIKGRDNEYLLVWTTTPWTLSSNVACAVGLDIVYLKAKKDGKIYYVSKKVAEEVLGSDYEELGEVSGAQLIGLEYEGPYDNLPAQKGVVHKVVDWEEVGEEDGTGIVHIAPGCGAEDFELGKERNLPAIAPIDENGEYVEGFGWLTGKHVKEVKPLIIKDLEERGILFKVGKITHRYPTCWRCKEELVFRKTDSWFIKADEVRDKMKELNEKIYWYPDFGGKIMNNWLDNLKDWNFSRKRYWGAPLPFWVCEKCGHLHVIGSRKELEEKAIKGIEQLNDLHRPNIDKVVIKCEECGADAKRVEEVADAWLDSGVVPYSTLHYLKDKNYWEEWFPSEFISEMREQIRLWFYSMLFISTVMEEKTPFEKALIFEKVYDEKGREMHKSGKNVIWFDEGIEKIGADVMRWMYVKTNPTQNVLFGYTIGREVNNKLSYLVNIGNYLEKFLEEKPEEVKAVKPEDKWLLSRLEKTKKEATQHLEKLEIHLATRKIEDFLENTLSKEYIKYTRNRMKTEKKEVTGLIYKALLDTAKMMAPFTPFITDYIYQKHFKKYEEKESIHLMQWPSYNEHLIDENLEEEMNEVKKTIEEGLAKRNELKINLRQPLQKMTITAKKLDKWFDLIKEQVNVKEIEEGEEIGLDTNITPELAKEGLTREITRRIQQMRKELKLIESDEILLNINPKPDINYEELQKTTNAEKAGELSEADLTKKFKVKETEYEIKLKKKKN